MTIKQALQWGIEQLKKLNIDSAELDAELFLAQAVVVRIRASVDIKKNNDPSRNGAIAPFREGRRKGVDRAWLYAHPEGQLTNLQLKTYKLFIKRRAQREPVAYILGHKEFYGLDFEVNKNVLIPRPETEVIVDQAIEEVKRSALHDPQSTIIDVGTGSGAIIIAIAKTCNFKPVAYFATDISKAVLKVAKQNARNNGVGDKIKFLQGNLLEPLFVKAELFSRQSSALVIIANLPYGFSGEYKKLQPEITKYEPRVAVDGGKDGLKYYREMFEQLSVFIRNHPCVSVLCLCEIDPRQTVSFKKFARKYFPKAKIEIIKDLAGKNRVVKVRI